MIFDQIYQLNWASLPMHLLPHSLRQSRSYAWLVCLLKPVQNLHTQFLSYRTKKNCELDHTPQVYSIEKVLNDAFDQQERRIYIVDGVYLSAVYFYNPDENAPVHFYNPQDNADHPRFYNPQELEQLDVDFVVVLPTEFQNNYIEGSSQLIRLKSLIDFYRLPDKTYQIKFES